MDDAGMQGPESRGRISAFCFDSPRCCLGVPWVPFRRPKDPEPSHGANTSSGTKRTGPPLFLGNRKPREEGESGGGRKEEDRARALLYYNGHSPKWPVPPHY
ncbi:hypothetical protein KM043_015359 [Ampulex compressa]|nr:hypothetical protein KM043_015359 [Ampulex compressa]